MRDVQSPAELEIWNNERIEDFEDLDVRVRAPHGSNYPLYAISLLIQRAGTEMPFPFSIAGKRACSDFMEIGFPKKRHEFDTVDILQLNAPKQFRINVTGTCDLSVNLGLARPMRWKFIVSTNPLNCRRVTLEHTIEVIP
ncbi:hypothetical protein T06_4367 [Trichinella sp. T6]|nr:hypothetical protein T06_14141 [Trichinella sp. T6]KRX70157.1 hypothetical protein T06_4367 [Trichinella sp. T6]